MHDEGSRPHFARVELQGVPMHGVLVTGEDMTIINGLMFKRVPINARDIMVAPMRQPMSVHITLSSAFLQSKRLQ